MWLYPLFGTLLFFFNFLHDIEPVTSLQAGLIVHGYDLNQLAFVLRA